MFRFPGTQFGGRKASKKGGPRRSGKTIPEPEPSTSSDSSQKLTKGVRGKYAALADIKGRGRMRACMICSLIKTDVQFEDDGCDNCERFLQFAGTRGSVVSYTSENFEGMIALITPKDSWVAKWQHLTTLKPGMYAVNVLGELEDWVMKEVQDAGCGLISRDRSQRMPNDSAQSNGRRRRRERSLDEESVEESVVNETPALVEDESIFSDDEVPTEEQNQANPNESERPGTTNNSLDRSDAVSVVSTTPAYRSGRKFSSSEDDSD